MNLATTLLSIRLENKITMVLRYSRLGVGFYAEANPAKPTAALEAMKFLADTSNTLHAPTGHGATH